ncbi:MAG: O-antigen ligase family protein [Rhodomicrobium sp.]
MFFALCCAVLSAAVILGGGTRNGFYGDVAVQLLAIPLLAAALWPAFSRESPQRKSARAALFICAIAAFVVSLQVFPLPFDYWSGGAVFLPAGQSALLSSGPHSFSLTPEASLAAGASLIPPLAIFAAVVQLPLRQRMYLCWLLGGLGALSLGLGFLQVAQGEASDLRFYEFTNPTEAVGFFANRNHFAAYLNVTLILAALWLALAAEASFEARVFGSRALLWLAAAAAFLVADVAGLAMARSRAGIGVAIAALLGIVLMALRARSESPAREGRRSAVHRASLAAALFAALFAAQFGLGGILTRFEADPIEDLRVAFNRTMLETIPKAMPLGTGLGSFVPVYATVERREDAFAGFANRAHNDFAEFLLETGLLGAGLALAFLAWFLKRAFQAWAARRQSGHSIEPLLERAATLIIALLLFHSLVDYPLRTAALSAILAVFCAILAVPALVLPGSPAKAEHHRRGARRTSSPVPLAEKWDSGAGWPQSWQRR